MIAVLKKSTENYSPGVYEIETISVEERDWCVYLRMTHFTGLERTYLMVKPAAIDLFLSLCSEAISDGGVIHLDELVDMANNPAAL